MGDSRHLRIFVLISDNLKNTKSTIPGPWSIPILGASWLYTWYELIACFTNAVTTNLEKNYILSPKIVLTYCEKNWRLKDKNLQNF